MNILDKLNEENRFIISTAEDDDGVEVKDLFWVFRPYDDESEPLTLTKIELLTLAQELINLAKGAE